MKGHLFNHPGHTMNQSKSSGFTIIELMAVVSILSILVVLALSAYSDYVVRSKITEGMNFAAEAKTSVSEYYYTTNDMPADNSEAGLAEPEEYENFQYIRKLEITALPKPGTITITFKIPRSKANNKELQLIPSSMKGIVFWTCETPAINGIDINHAPPNCRG